MQHYGLNMQLLELIDYYKGLQKLEFYHQIYINAM